MDKSISEIQKVMCQDEERAQYLPCEYVSLELSGGIFARICSVTSVKFPAQLAYLARTVVPRATVQKRIGIL